MNNSGNEKPFASESGEIKSGAQTDDKNEKSGNKPVNGTFGEENECKKFENFAEAEPKNKSEPETVKNKKNAGGSTDDEQKANEQKANEQKGGELYAAKKAAQEYNAKKSDVEQKKFIKGLIISYGVCFLIAAGLCLWISAAQGVFELTEPRAIFAVLSDAFFVPGVLISGFGLLYKIADGGFLDGVSFGLKRAVLSLIPGGRLKKEESYAEYKERKDKKRKNIKISAPLIVGLVFIVIAAIFLILYGQAK